MRTKNWKIFQYKLNREELREGELEETKVSSITEYFYHSRHNYNERDRETES